MGNSNDRNTIAGNNIQHSNVTIGDGARQVIQPTPQSEQEVSYPAFSPKQSEISPTQTPWIFLSHSSRDNEFCVHLAKDLYQALGDDVAAVWYDIEGLNGGNVWWHRITQELTARSIFIVVLSPDAVVSGWVKDEIAMAWRQRNSPAGKLIIPVLYRRCNVPEDLAILQIISFLPPKQYRVAFNELLKAIGVRFGL